VVPPPISVIGRLPVFLEPAQHHDVQQDARHAGWPPSRHSRYSRDRTVDQGVIQRLQIGAVRQIAALRHDMEEFGFGTVGHGLFLSNGADIPGERAKGKP
jgi:hypothetical protein